MKSGKLFNKIACTDVFASIQAILLNSFFCVIVEALHNTLKDIFNYQFKILFITLFKTLLLETLKILCKLNSIRTKTLPKPD